MSEVHSVSVAVTLENSLEHNFGFMAGGLILIQKRETGLLGLVAGHMEKETPLDGIYREIEEETGLKPDEVRINRQPDVLAIPGRDKTSVGILFKGKTVRPISQEGYEPESDEIARVRPFSIEEILYLISNPDLLYKPEFNLTFLCKALLDYIGTKYAFDSPEFQTAIAEAWGIPHVYIAQYL